MSFLKKSLAKLKEKTHRNSGDFSDDYKKENGANGASHSGIDSPNGAATPTSEHKRQSKEILREQKVRKSLDKERNKIEAMKRAQLARIESQNFMATGPPDLTKLYRPYSMNMSKNWNHENRILLKDIDFSSKLICQ
jgi:hypothetical protein